ncbi:UDP-glucose/GDP-mannose dehydrogenase family protein [Pseudenhygromyxa sp. WMMC2535]|uniref:UDP-glucose dehydrogenase family protein n=1 Tax=Pseudenhygromyxa sp. WMMC2535 TaxID=2712867 RepID=UPI001555398F|nr:UDP-glucose/GDP-mannose dehydrogenase family protein [Pseudenhygromyxa sp. WMMC2535]NVB37456.1 UDP-glucose/GDP-mannose dehydrogenase family protein [Pseudenhygromyxa sp. WMMC2535]
MKVSVIGTGYVGLVAAAAFADHGNDVVCADIDEAKIEGLKQGVIPIYEPGLEPLVKRNVAAGRLKFTTSNADAAKHAEIIFLAVGTPTGGTDGAPKLDYLFQAARDVAANLSDFTVIVNKSTVPVGTAERVTRIINEIAPDADFVVASNPEFLKEGVAVQDFMHPDRVIIGTEDERARELLHRLYHPFFRTSERLLFMNARSAELTKYASNAYLAARISFINDVANLCDAVGADVEEVRRGMGSDARIGNKFLYPGVGYGGSCFPKDTRALIRTAREHGLSMSIVASADRINESQKLVLVRKIRAQFGDVAGKTLAIWGLAFKPNTDDIREAPALSIVRSLASDGAKLRLTDPEAGPNFMAALGDSVENFGIEFFDDPYEAAKGADALIMTTEWRQYRSPDFPRLAEIMQGKALFDGRNQWEREEVEALGFFYTGIGR